LTGCDAFRALPDYPAGRIDPSLATLAGTLQDAGYHTCYSGKWHNDGHPLQRGYVATGGLYSSGGARGVALPAVDARGRPLTGYRGWTFKDAENLAELDKGVGLRPDNSRHIADGAMDALRAAPRNQPFFLHVNFAFPHDPRQWPVGMRDSYDPNQIPIPRNFLPQHPFDHGNLNGRDELLVPKPLRPEALREELALYYAMISDVDRQVGRLIETLKDLECLDQTLVVFTSDQGLAMGSHGLLGKQNQYEHSIRSPLIMAGPEIPIGEQVDALVHLADLFPTFCDYAGIEIPKTVQYKSLMPLLRDEVDQVHPWITGVFTDSQRMICDERWKYIAYPKAGREQLFDLQNDPDEIHDLHQDGSQQDVVIRIRRQLDRWRREQNDPDPLFPVNP
jgi:arylsulfatase A-like enzyme